MKIRGCVEAGMRFELTLGNLQDTFLTARTPGQNKCSRRDSDPNFDLSGDLFYPLNYRSVILGLQF